MNNFYIGESFLLGLFFIAFAAYQAGKHVESLEQDIREWQKADQNMQDYSHITKGAFWSYMRSHPWFWFGIFFSLIGIYYLL